MGMRNLKFPVTEEEYLEILKRKGDKTHKETYLTSLGIDYTPPKVGRPSAVDIAELRAENDRLALTISEKARKQDEERINKAFSASRTSDIEIKKIRKAMGVDNESGDMVPRRGQD